MSDVTIPPRILALETSMPQASLFFGKEDDCPVHLEWVAERSHNSRIFEILQDIRDILEARPPELIIVGSGPGSYSGIRVALAVADGLSLVYKAPVVALPSWQALPGLGDKALVFSDARRGGWAVGEIIAGLMIGSPSILSGSELKERIHSAQAEGYKVLTPESPEKLAAGNYGEIVAGVVPAAEMLYKNWLSIPREEKKRLLLVPPSPLYVRDPHITPAKRASWEKGRDARKFKH